MFESVQFFVSQTRMSLPFLEKKINNCWQELSESVLEVLPWMFSTITKNTSQKIPTIVTI